MREKGSNKEGIVLEKPKNLGCIWSDKPECFHYQSLCLSLMAHPGDHREPAAVVLGGCGL